MRVGTVLSGHPGQAVGALGGSGRVHLPVGRHHVRGLRATDVFVRAQSADGVACQLVGQRSGGPMSPAARVLVEKARPLLRVAADA